MISTHNHVDMAASSVGAGQLKLTLLPPTRASNSVTARPPPGPGSTAALCAGSRDPDTPRQASRSGLAGRGARPAADHAQAPVGLSPSGHAQPAQSQPPRPAPHERRTRAGVNRPDATTATPTGAVWRGRAKFALLGRGNNPSMVVLRRNGRRRAAGVGPMVRAFGETRTCAEDGCTAQLSRYNPARCCAIHQGWDRQRVTRPRQHRF
jgi:hypothetical protein